MKMINIRTLAKLIGINPGKFTKTDLIKKIQIVEGNFDCFATAYSGECDQVNCMWREECFDTAVKEAPL